MVCVTTVYLGLFIYLFIYLNRSQDLKTHRHLPNVKEKPEEQPDHEEELGHSCRLLHVFTSEGKLNLKFLMYFSLYMK